MSYQTVGATNIANGVTSVDCQKQVRSWRLLRSLIELLIPSCYCTTSFVEEHDQTKQHKSYHNHLYLPKPSSPSNSTTITGTIFGFRRGKACFCVQSSSKSTNKILLIELAIPTAVLAREMQGGVLRIALESTNSTNNIHGQSNSLLSMPVWTMYCNGRKVGYAIKRKPSKSDMEALRLMSSVVVGAGIIGGKELESDDELMYLRASFERVNSGSAEAESFHLIDPDGCIGQELSIFFFRSRRS